MNELQTVTMVRSLIGPPVYANWLASSALGAAEYPLFTDARVTGQVTCGPYEFLNTVPCHESGLIQPAIVLRCSRHAEWPEPDMSKTDTERYHGGSFPQEVAALSSLATGIRLRAGGSTRSFEPGGDPRGVPHEWNTRPVAGMLVRKDSRGWVLPNAAKGARVLDKELAILNLLPKLAPSSATSLVRAARQYQEALWLVESEPSLSWLMLVSALETAANEWRRQSDTPVDRLKCSKPKLYEYLEGLCPEAVTRVAEEFKDSFGVSKKFNDFVIEFLPPEPPTRPPEGWRHDWGEKEMRQSMSLIYRHRSKALHDGVPFPLPMCELPFHHTEWETEAYAERPSGCATSAAGGTWVKKDTPIVLHTFEYIARNVLLNWWKQGAPEAESTAAAEPAAVRA